MFEVYECAACVLVLWFGMTLLFMACVMFLALQEGCTMVAHRLPDLMASSFRLIGRRLAIEPRDD
jgi:predicted CDP-diglyceride synthetase/phosphatidate cytidylyltransferase